LIHGNEKKLYEESQTSRSVVAPCDARDRTSHIFCGDGSGEVNAEGCHEKSEKDGQHGYEQDSILVPERVCSQNEKTLHVPEFILSSIRHLLVFPFEVRLKYKFAARRIEGRYRVTIYRPFTLFQCDQSKNVHSS
jgi:hypothetical protein